MNITSSVETPGKTLETLILAIEKHEKRLSSPMDLHFRALTEDIFQPTVFVMHRAYNKFVKNGALVLRS